MTCVDTRFTFTALLHAMCVPTDTRHAVSLSVCRSTVRASCLEIKQSMHNLQSTVH